MAVPTADKVLAIAADVGSQRRLAELLGVSPSRVTRWIGGEGIDAVNADRVDLLELVLSRLDRVYGVEGARLWLTGLNPHLGDRRPIDLIRTGRTRALLDALEQEQAGSYA